MPQLEKSFNFDSFWKKHSVQPYYPGKVVVNYERKDGTENGLHVEIETPHLNLNAITRADQVFYHELRANANANRLFASGNPLDKDTADKVSSAQIARWESGVPLGGFIISLAEPEGNDLKTNRITSSIDDEGRIGYVVLGYGGSNVRNTAQTATILDPSFWQKGYAKEALWSIRNPYAHCINSKHQFIGRNNQPLVGIESTVHPDNVCSIDTALNSGADIQCIPQALKLPVDDVELVAINTANRLPQPININGASRFLFFQPKKHFMEAEPTLSTEALLPNVARLVNSA